MNGAAAVEPAPAPARSWAAAGFAEEIVPVCGPHHRCASPGKRPHALDWRTVSFAPGDFAPGGNVGLRTRRFPAIDIDVEDASVVAAVEDVARETFGTTARRSRSNSPRCALLYRLDGEPFKKTRIVFDTPDGAHAKIEVLGDGQQLVIEGIHNSDARYEWIGSPIEGGSLARMAAQTRDDFLAAVRGALEAAGCRNVKVDREEPRNGERKQTPRLLAAADKERARKYADGAVADARRKIEEKSEGDRNEELNRQAFGLGQLVAGGVLSRQIAEAELTAAALRVGLTPSETRASIRSGLDAGAREPRGLPPENTADAELPPPETENPRGSGGKQEEKRSAVEYVLTSMASIQPKPVRWLWRDRIAFGKITILDGDPGNGKSTIALDLAARLSTGRPMPGEDKPVGPPMRVLLISIEDDPADTLRPRLDAAGANCELIDTLTIKAKGRELIPVLSDHLVQMEDALLESDAKFLVLDPLSALMGKADMFKDQEVRSVLGPLKGVLERNAVASTAIRHFNKTQGGASALYRGGGSIAIAASARSVLAVARNPQNPIQRVLALVKGNGAEPQEVQSLAYGIEKVTIGDIETIRIRWEGVSAFTADELLAAQVPDSREERGALDEAKDFLLQVLAAGPVPSKDLEKERRAAGVAETTLKRARTALGVKARLIGGRWFSSLPNRSTATDDLLDPLAESDGSP